MTLRQALQHAIQLHQAGRLPQAETLYKQILAAQPNQPDSLHFLGVIAHQSGQHESAVELINRAIALRPNYTDAFNNLGNALRSLGQFDRAITAYQRAIELDPSQPEAFNNLGIALRETGLLDQAMTAYRKAIALRPSYHNAFSNMGVVLQDQGNLDAAIASFRHAIALKPAYADGWVNLANALKDKGQMEEAVSACRQAIAIKPDDAQAYNNLGIALGDQGELDESIAAFEQSILHQPSFVQAHCNLVYALQYHPRYDAAATKQQSLRWSRQHAQPLWKFIADHSNTRDPDRRLRIGYVSADLNRHPVGRFLLPLLANHDKKQFEIFAYSNGRISDEQTEQLRSCCDGWRSILGLPDSAAVERIRQDQIDILVDLAGHTSSNRLLVFASKPAPVQVTYLGYPATTGIEAIDYRLTDSLADPPGMTDSHGTETLARLPRSAWCYAPPPNAPPVADLPARTKEFITFGSFNNFAKVNEPLLKLWAEILRQTPRSRLFLKSRALLSEAVQQRVRHIMRDAGITPDRLTLRGFVPGPDHLVQYNQLDIALDTFPYHGTTTTCESLWMGVPVITLAGATHASRVGVSLLSNAGLPEWVATNPEQYVSIATQWAADVPRLSQLHESLRERLSQSRLMDAAAFAGDVEVAYRQMWRTWCDERT